MVLYIDFEWETEPLKMALSKNFTLPEKCKNHQRAPTVQCWSDSFFESKLFGSSLISQRNWRGPLLAPPSSRPPRRRQKRDPAPIPAVNVQVYFKWRRKESKNQRGDVQNENHVATFSPKKKIKISVFWLFMSFFVVFHMNAACVFFTLILFFHLFTHPLPHRLIPPPHPPKKKNPPGENRSQWGHMHKKGQKQKTGERQ